jgi:DNA end-binding protein Ku
MNVMRATMSAGIQIGLITIPIKIYKAADDRQGITLRQLHKCGQRINEKKWCPEHGEITIAEVVKGYEHAPSEYVLLTDDEIGDFTSTKVISIDQFVPAGSVDFPRETYYLGTDQLGARAYALLTAVMRKQDVVAVTRVSMRGRERLATIEPGNNVLRLVTHYWPEEIRDPAGIVPVVPEASQAEQTMARQLVKGMTSEFQAANWVDKSTSALVSLIEAKIAGRAVSPVESKPAKPPIDLAAALIASIEAQKKPRGRKKAA